MCGGGEGFQARLKAFDGGVSVFLLPLFEASWRSLLGEHAGAIYSST